MPLPPPAIPEPAPTVDGPLAPDWGGGSCEVGGSGRLSTLLAGAACGGAIDPVASGLPLGAYGLSLKRTASPLQAATPMDISVNTATRGQNRERKCSITQVIATHSYAIQATS
jgi:hypothetical protein